MAPKFGIGIGHGETYELVKHTREGSDGSPRIVSLADDVVQSTRALPPKTLPRRRTKRSIAVVILLVICLIIAFALIFLVLGNPMPTNFGVTLGDDNTCDLETLTGNTMQSAFTINLRCPSHLTFAEAKAVDVTWDLFVGQGGRFFLGWISYKVFMDGLLRIMENTAVSYELYASLAFEPNCMMSLWNSIKALFMMKGWRSKVFLGWFFISTLYVLAFSTLISAGSGYVTPSTAGLIMPDGSFVTASSETLTKCYILQDGALIGLTNGTIVVGPPAHVFNDAIDPTEVPKYEKLKASSSALFYAIFTCKQIVKSGIILEESTDRLSQILTAQMLYLSLLILIFQLNLLILSTHTANRTQPTSPYTIKPTRSTITDFTTPHLSAIMTSPYLMI